MQDTSSITVNNFSGAFEDSSKAHSDDELDLVLWKSTWQEPVCMGVLLIPKEKVFLIRTRPKGMEGTSNPLR